MSSLKNTLLLGTRKGLVVFEKANGQWKFKEDHFEGIPVSYATADSKGKYWWACQDHGHWGCKLHRSDDQGKTWTELEAPVYHSEAEIKENVPATLKYIWVLHPEVNGNPDHIYLGTDPGGLFESKNAGESFELVKGLWDHPSRKTQWFGGGRDNPGIHSIIIDNNNSNHQYVGISVAGVFETIDGGKTWDPRNKGLKADFLPDPESEIGQDPHYVTAHPKNQKIMWQQNHCSIYRTVDGGQNWSDIASEDGIAKFGFVITLDEEDEDTAWVVPAISDEKRVAIDRGLIVCKTMDGGKTWQKQTNGLPQKGCYDIVYRHAMDITGSTLAFGTTTGNLFISDDKGEQWSALSHYLPMIYSVRFV